PSTPSYGHHRDLHSFPTRRSSDLEDVQAIRAIIQSLYGEEIANRFTTSSISEDTIHQVAILLAETTDCSQWVDAVPNPKDLLMPDRKSTRLNSSHVKISYAVFCLK